MPRDPEEVTNLKEIINRGADMVWFQSYARDVFETVEDVDLSYIFQKVFLHACLKKKPEIANWMKEVCFPYLPEIEQIAVRQCFSYGNFLLKK
jgi:hypothetical protein